MRHNQAKREAYAEWYVTPEEQRPFRTAWCDQNGVDESTCIRWEKQSWFGPLVEEVKQRLALTPDDLQSVVEAMREKALGGDPRAMDLYLKYHERMNAGRLDAQDPSEWSDEELAELLQAELDEVLARIANATAA